METINMSELVDSEVVSRSSEVARNPGRNSAPNKLARIKALLRNSTFVLKYVHAREHWRKNAATYPDE